MRIGGFESALISAFRIMKARSKISLLMCLLLIVFICIYSAQIPRAHSWGWDTHKFIESKAEQAFSDNSFFSGHHSTFYDWCIMPDQVPNFMPDGGGDSDWHFLDAENYNPLQYTGGELPWAMEWVFDNIVQYLKDENWDTAAQLMGAICHFTGDATMPLHSTYNYNPGGNHSAYETQVNNEVDIDNISILDNYVPQELDNITNVALATLAESFSFTAEGSNGGVNLTDFLENGILWNDWIKSMTENRVSAAVQFTVNVWYTAMIKAGLTIQAPILLSPTDNFATTNNTLTFTWTSIEGASSYDFQLASDNDFTAGTLIVRGLPTNAYTLVEPLKGGEWYWRVRTGDNSTDVGLWSPARRVIVLTPNYKVAISPRYQNGMPGTMFQYGVTARNIGVLEDNYYLTVGDDAGWSLVLSDNLLENVQPGENKMVNLSVTLPENVVYYIQDNITVTAVSAENAEISESSQCIAAVVMALLSPPHSDYGLDTDDDNLYNYLAVDANVAVAEAGWYQISGDLYDNAFSNLIVSTSAENYLDVSTQTIELLFDGRPINRSGVDGSYLVDLCLQDEWGNFLDNGEHETQSYYHENFQYFAKLSPPHADYGIDTDADNLYNFLVVDVNVVVSAAGWYSISSDLYDNANYRITSASADDYLDVGTQTLELRFDGKMIHYSEKDGPYRVSMSLYDNWGNWLDSGEHVTEAYTSVQFQIAMYSQLLPTDDAMVWQAYPDYNYGYNTYFYVGRYYSTAERAFLKFDISDIPKGATIVDAVYWDYCWKVLSGGANVQVQAVEDDAWSEYNITWNYQPALGPVLDGPYQVGGSAHWYSWDITNFVAEKLAGDKIVSICMVDTGENSGGQESAFESKEWGYPHPYLEITYIPPPYAVNVSISPNSGSGLPGNTLIYSVTVTNTGLLDDNYELTVMDTAGWDPIISTTSVTLQSGQAGNATLAVSLPENVPFSVDYVTVTATSQSSDNISNSYEVEATAFPAKLAPPHSDYGLDTDNDNFYNYLIIDVNVEVSTAGLYQISGDLYDHNGNYIPNAYTYAENYLEAGTQTIELRFRGDVINHSGMDGPSLAYLWLYDNEGNWLDSGEYWTAAYTHDQFQPPPAKLAPPHSDYGLDTDNDGLYNYLVIDVNVAVTEAGWYQISGDLIADRNWIASASTDNYLDVCVQTIELRFDGEQISRSGMDGPYLAYLWLYDNEGNWLDSGEYWTAVYTHDQFQLTRLTPPHSDYGLDTDNDNFYNYLVIDVNVEVSTAGWYQLSGDLYDPNGNYITYASIENYLDVGVQTIELRFDGWRINRSGWDGPYRVSLNLYSYDYGLLDSGEYWTAAYTHDQFQPPPAKLAPPHSDYGLDTDNDGLYNYLVIEANVSVTTAGWYSISSDLYDNAYNWIASASADNYLDVGTQTIELRFDGWRINRSGWDGPYRLSLNLYCAEGWLDNGEHLTSAYTHNQFQLPIWVIRGPIYIDGNDNFTLVNGVTSGSGTENDPYIIENWDISAENANGIEVRDTTVHFVIRNCYVHDGRFNWEYGIFFYNVLNGIVENNLAEYNSLSVYFDSSDNNLISGNTVRNSYYGIILASYSENNIVSKNTVNNNSNDGIFLYLSDNNLIENNQMNNDYFGIRLFYESNNNIVSKNTMKNNSYGIYFYYSSNNLIESNLVSNNSEYAIYLYYSDNNLVYHNTFTNNMNQAYDSGSNYWDDGYPSGGNYWSGFTGADNYKGENQNISGGDGICDTPYYIPVGSNCDRYPLINPITGAYTKNVFTGMTVVDARNETDTMLTVSANQAGSVSVVKYEYNPCGAPPSGFTALGKYIEVRTDIASENIVWPVEIRIYYTDEEVAAAGIPENNLRIFHWDGINWVQEPDSGVNTENNYVWARVTNISPFALMADTIPPASPSLQSPENNAGITMSTPTFRWSLITDPSGVTYTLEIDNEPNFAEPVLLIKSGLSDNSYVLSSVESLANGTYYWRVRAVDRAGNEGDWSEIWTFTVNLPPQPSSPSLPTPSPPPAHDTTPPPTPALISPGNGSTIADATPILDWSDVSDPSGVTYSLSIAKDSGFVSIVLEKSGLTFSTYELTSGESLPSGTYYWRVQAVDSAGNSGSWSENWSFTVSAAPTSVVTPQISLAIPIGIVAIAIIAIGLTIIVKRQKSRTL